MRAPWKSCGALPHPWWAAALCNHRVPGELLPCAAAYPLFLDIPILALFSAPGTTCSFDNLRRREGVNSFLLVAEANKSKQGFMCCPCLKCKNEKDYSCSRDIKSHLLRFGFMSSYNVWTKHGEEGVMMEDGDEEEDNDDQYRSMFSECDDTAMDDNEEEGGEEQASDDPVDDDLRCEDGHRKLGSILELLKWKAEVGVTDSGFEKLMIILKKLFPRNNELPVSTYEAKKLVCPLELDVQKIHACINDCILYRGEKYENLNKCPICGALRYKIRKDDPGDVEGEPPRKRVPAKVMWYAPIIPRLKRLFRNKEHAQLLRWHMEERKKDAMLRHPADGRQWRNIGREFPDFAAVLVGQVTIFKHMYIPRYEINGNTFYTIDQDKKSTNQNSGVRFDATDENGQTTTYYGYIEEIWELDYGPTFKVPLFRCKWVKLSGIHIDDKYGMITVDPNNLAYLDEPFVLASEVAQARHRFYFVLFLRQGVVPYMLYLIEQCVHRRILILPTALVPVAATNRDKRLPAHHPPDKALLDKPPPVFCPGLGLISANLITLSHGFHRMSNTREAEALCASNYPCPAYRVPTGWLLASEAYRSLLSLYEEDGPPSSNFNEAGRRMWWRGRTLQSVMAYRGPRCATLNPSPRVVIRRVLELEGGDPTVALLDLRCALRLARNACGDRALQQRINCSSRSAMAICAALAMPRRSSSVMRHGGGARNSLL
ncbi:hypothetical protein QYE76_002042 [Lolium multiflorum]|uniref:Transposon protein, putative, CACTA, En/Spm sub-class n=1 Tax=Lolium multiflorum TaxID=4521 RepID=A0AAD8RN82_LOLMU|nr:hypothetical protein QYE76_002042 [Lolium multiflorum]